MCIRQPSFFKTIMGPTEINFADILYDRDPQVVSNCISVLVEVLASEGGMVVTTKLAHYFLNRSDIVMSLPVRQIKRTSINL